MGDVKRSMDDFLINPTVPMDEENDFRKSTSSNRHSMYIEPSSDMFAKYGKETEDASGSLRQFDDDAIWWREYGSDEEVASPADDEFTFDSNSSDSESIASIHEAQYHAQTCNNATQLCNRAQAVQVLSAGKPKVVSMPKLIGTPATYSHPPSNSVDSEIRPSMSSMSHVRPTGASNYVYSSITSSPRSSGEDSVYSSTPVPRSMPSAGDKFVRRKPNLPRIQTGVRSESPQSNSTASPPRTAIPTRRVDFLDYDPFPSDDAAPAPDVLPRRKLQKFRLKSISKSLRRGSIPDFSSESTINKRDIGYPKMSPLMPETYAPTRTSSKPVPKMVARGASERAAAIEIPPCPSDYEDDLKAPVWPARSDSVANFEPPKSRAEMHQRRKSLSAFVSAQMS